MNNYIIFDRTTFDNIFVHIYEIASIFDRKYF